MTFLSFKLVNKNYKLFDQKNNLSEKMPPAHQGCIYLIKNTVKTVIMWNIILI